MFKIKLLYCSVMAGAASLGAPAGTTFTYQGQVKMDGLPLDGVADFRISLWNDPVSSLTPPVVQENLSIQVTNGLFTVELDFGSSPFSDARWLGIEVRFPAGNGNYQLLSPRQPVTAAPLALHALNSPSSGESLWAANGNDIYKTNSGNVGIGTTTPSQALHVVGRILAQTSGVPIQGTKQGTGTFPGVHGETESTSADASGTRGYVLSTTPGARSAGLWGRNFGTTANGYGIRGTHDGTGAGVFGEASDAAGFGGYFQGRGYFSGSLGLGLTNPIYPLDVAADAQDRGIRSAGTVFISKGYQVPGVGLSVSRVTTTNPVPISARTEIDGSQIDAYTTLVATGSTLRLNSSSVGNVTLVQGGGRVGIGIATPQRLLQVGDNTIPNSEGMIRLASRSGTQGSNRVWDIGVPETDADSSGIGYSFIIDDISTGSEPEFMIKWGTGGVGIGTTSIPSGVRLAVRGKVLAEELEVQLFQNWPDYVFADDYELMPLDELEARIREDRRLPGIPSAHEVETNGLAVGAMQVRMMEKVEELTLYVIQLNRELEDVKCRNARLESELEALQLARAAD